MTIGVATDDEGMEQFPEGITPLMVLGGIAAIGIALFALTRTAAAQAVEKLQLSVNVRGDKPSVKDMRTLAKMLREQLPAACPGAPTLNTTLRRNIVKVENGYRIVYTFDANFAGDELGFVKTAVGNCIFTFIKERAPFGGDVVGIRAERIA